MYVVICLFFIIGIILIVSIGAMLTNSSSNKPVYISEKTRATLIIVISLAVLFFYGAADLISFGAMK